jgi:hypothetical protein
VYANATLKLKYSVWGLIHCAGGSVTNAVDIFDAKSGDWATAALSSTRFALAATSLPNDGVAIFAGGGGTSCS